MRWRRSTPPGIDLVYDAVTTTAAGVLGVDGHRLEVGGNADLVVHHHATLREVLAHHAAPAYVVASGRLVASSTTSATTFHLDEQGVLDMTDNRRIRIGIDTGGTFTDVVAFDEDSGELVTTKTPSTPSNPADGFLAGIDKVLGLIGADGSAIDAVSHGTTVATNQLLEGKVDRLGFVTTEGYEAMLEIARQSVPDGYGNSYFWVKPDRIVPRDLVKGVGGRLDFTGAEVRPFDEDGARGGRPLVPGAGDQHPRRLLPARLRQPRARGADARDPRRGAPRRGGVAVERGAARVPRVRTRDDHARRRGGQAAAVGVRQQHQVAARRPTTTGRSRST